MDKLIMWKDEPDRKPLLLQGIRYCGKTYLLKDFGERFFGNVLYFDFSQDMNLANLFGQSSDPQTIIKNLSIYREKDITPGKTLIILDEIQICTAAFESLKYFSDEARQYHIAAACSFLDIALPQGLPMLAGKVEHITLYPMNFYEFLLAQSPMLALHLKESSFKEKPYNTFKKQLEEKFRDFQIVGGMPEVVKSWIDTHSIETVDKLQTQIINSYENDFAHLCSISMLPKLISVWNTIPAQLIKSNRKFMFSKIKKSWRGKDLEDAIYRLIRAGLIYKVVHINRPDMPISGYINQSHFKLYMCDAGLLRRTGGFPSSMMLSSDNVYSNMKGAIAENIVCCELMRIYQRDLYYWSAENPGRAEVDFIIHDDEMFIPVEVKAGSAGRARSLLQYRMRFKPKKYVLTGADSDKDDVLPLYMFWNLQEWLKNIK